MSQANGFSPTRAHKYTVNASVLESRTHKQRATFTCPIFSLQTKISNSYTKLENAALQLLFYFLLFFIILTVYFEQMGSGTLRPRHQLIMCRSEWNFLISWPRSTQHRGPPQKNWGKYFWGWFNIPSNDLTIQTRLCWVCSTPVLLLLRAPEPPSVNGRIPVWVRLCLSRWLRWINLMSHMEQAYGFTPTHTEQYISPTTHMCNTYKSVQLRLRC